MKINSEQEMLDFGKSFADIIKFPMVIELIGDVGAGKTTFTRGLAEGLGAKDKITSPSFTISKSYTLPKGKKLIHYDFYRLANPGLMSKDLNESITDQNTLTIIEWSNTVKDVLPKNHTIVKITKTQDDSRSISIKDSQNSVSRKTDINNNRNNTLRDTPRATGSELTKSPVTTEEQSERNSNLFEFPSEEVPSRKAKTGATKCVKKSIVRLFLDTSTPETILKINNKEYRYVFANNLAEKLLQFIKDKLDENHLTWQNITEIEFMTGPGSFTGLRIGATVVNTLAHELNIPLYNHHHKKQRIIIPDYGHAANISKPVK